MSKKRKYLDEPDWDPAHPYHYHTSNGEKVIVSEEDWNKYKDDPAFKKVKDVIEAEQAAHPGPEYEINPQFVQDLKDVYKGNLGSKYQNYKNYQDSLPTGYSFTDEGLIQDKDGNLYVQEGFKQSPRFSYNTNNPLRFTIEQGRPIQRNLIFYSINMDKRIKPSIPVTKTMNVGKKKEEAVNNYVRNNAKKYLPPISFVTSEDNKEPYGELFIGSDGDLKFLTHEPIWGNREIINDDIRNGRFYKNGSTENLNDSIDAKEYNRQVDLINDFISHEEWFPGIYWDNLTHITDTISNKQKALKNAVIEVEEPIIRKIKRLGGSTRRSLKDGGIYIKPSHRGRFTALKERTGHSATWFKENGTPAQKKMATFALNAAKWKH